MLIQIEIWTANLRYQKQLEATLYLISATTKMTKIRCSVSHPQSSRSTLSVLPDLIGRTVFQNLSLSPEQNTLFWSRTDLGTFAWWDRPEQIQNIRQCPERCGLEDARRYPDESPPGQIFPHWGNFRHLADPRWAISPLRSGSEIFGQKTVGHLARFPTEATWTSFASPGRRWTWIWTTSSLSPSLGLHVHLGRVSIWLTTNRYFT